jgi:hypothetical protein
MPYKYNHIADNVAAQTIFERNMPDLISCLLSGASSEAGCGCHSLQKHDDGILISRGTAEFIVRRLKSQAALAEVEVALAMANAKISALHQQNGES